MSEVESQSQDTQAITPEAFDAILADIKTFGIKDTDELITITVSGKRVQLRMSNVSDWDDIEANMRSEGYKGYMWVQYIRSEILARATTWINGVDVSTVPYATDPFTGEQRDTRMILADMYRRWGSQATLTLWKCYMVHCQKIEDDLIEQLPDSAIATEAEARFLSRVSEDLSAISAQAIAETVEASAVPLESEEG